MVQPCAQDVIPVEGHGGHYFKLKVSYKVA
jgi:hypothetical protein